MTGVDGGFVGRLFFLSNFDTTPFHVPELGEVVTSGEHAFNAFKTTDPAERRRVLDAATPGASKGVGRWVTLRPGWDEGVRVRAMQRVLVAKFAVPTLRDCLAATVVETLIEANDHHDNFWGSCVCGRPACAAPGKNMLGELIMAIRAANASAI